MKSGRDTSRGSPRIRKPPTVKISHKAAVRAQTQLRAAKPVSHVYTTTPQRSRPPSPPIPSYIKSTNSTVKSSPTKKSALDDENCIALRKQLFSNCALKGITTDDLSKLSSYLREYSTWCALKRRYDEAKKSDHLLENIRVELLKRSISKTNNKSAEEEFEIKKEEEMDKLTREVMNFNDETELKRQALLGKQEQDRLAFEKSWRDDMPRKYRKLSPRLLMLLRTEKQCVRVGDYDKAKVYKKEADKLMKQELDAAQSQLNSDYRAAKDRLVSKQQEELDRFESVRKGLKDVLITKQKHELESFVNRQKVITVKRDTAPRAAPEEASGSLTQLMQTVGLGYDTLLPPLLAPNDDKMLEHLKEVEKEKHEKRKTIKKNLEKSEERKEQKLQELRERYSQNNKKEARRVVFQTQIIEDYYPSSSPPPNDPIDQKEEQPVPPPQEYEYYSDEEQKPPPKEYEYYSSEPARDEAPQNPPEYEYYSDEEQKKTYSDYYYSN